MSLPIRQLEVCSCEWCRSMNDLLARIVRTLWWCFRLL